MPRATPMWFAVWPMMTALTSFGLAGLACAGMPKSELHRVRLLLPKVDSRLPYISYRTAGRRHRQFNQCPKLHCWTWCWYQPDLLLVWPDVNQRAVALPLMPVFLRSPDSTLNDPQNRCGQSC